MRYLKIIEYIVIKSLRHNAFSSTVTVVICSLACALVMSVFAIQAQTEKAFENGTRDFDAVLGARGSKIQLVLNSVFHLDASPGNISWDMYQAIKNDKRIRSAVPYSVGDNYYGFRIVGTTNELFNPQISSLKIVQGRSFDPLSREAVIGSFVAEKTGLGVGSIFNPYHGLYFDESKRHNEEYKVVGVLTPTNSANDKAIWIPLDSFYKMEGHVIRGKGADYQSEWGESIPDENKEVSSVMIKLKNPRNGFYFDQMINKQGKVATFAWPITAIVTEIFSRIEWANQVLKIVIYLVVVIVSLSIMASIYNTLDQRKRNYAILRAIGAHRSTLMGSILFESTTLSLIGSLLSFPIYGLILVFTSQILRTQVGIVLDIFWYHPILIVAPLCMALIGLASGVVPALKAYQADVLNNLSPQV